MPKHKKSEISIVIDEEYLLHEPVTLEAVHIQNMNFKFKTEKYCCADLESTIDVIFAQPHMVQCHLFSLCPYCGTKLRWYAASSKGNEDIDKFEDNREKELALNTV